MRRNNYLILGIFVLLVLTIVSANPYTLSNPKYTQGQAYSAFQGGELTSFNTGMCQEGTDFLVQIAPFGCTPAVVRSDLLEEQDVPVFCELQAIKMNPLINVEAIDAISFSGNYPREVVTVGFQPSYSALGENRKLNNLMWDNIGSAVIILRQQPNESLMPEMVSGNLTAKIRYDIEDAFGLRRQTFYLPVMEDYQFDKKLGQYSFFNRMGFLRAEDVTSNSATIGIYSGRYKNFFGASTEGEIERQKINQFTLQKGDTTSEIFLPGFDCLATVKFNLNNVEIADTRAKLTINSEIVEIKEGEKFLDEKCYVSDLEKNGLVQKLSVSCYEDDGRDSFDLRINPSIKLEITNEEIKDYVVGDKLYQANSGNSVYLAYAWTTDDGSSKEDLKAYFALVPGTKEKLSDSELRAAEIMAKNIEDNPTKNLLDLAEYYSASFRASYEWLFVGASFVSAEYNKYEDVGGKEVRIVGFGGKSNYPLNESKEDYENAIEYYDEVLNKYSSEKYPEGENYTLGEEALYSKIKLSELLLQREDLIGFCDEFLTGYSNSDFDVSICFELDKLSNTELSSEDVLIDGEYKRIEFDRIYEPSFSEHGVVLNVKNTKTGISESYELRKNQEISLGDNEESVKLIGVVDEDTAEFRFKLNKTSNTQQAKAILGFETSSLDKKFPSSFGSDWIFDLKEVNIKRMAKVSVHPSVNYQGSEAEFTFNVGIEKRDFQLSPEKTQSLIDKMNDTVVKWEKISDTMGDVVQTMKTACLGTGAALTVKNLISGSNGKTIAREEVMYGAGGWYEECADLKVGTETYSSEEDCLFENANTIDSEVNQIAKAMNDQNSRIKKIQEPMTDKHLLGQDVVDTDSFVGNYSGDVSRSIEWLGESIEVDGEKINVDGIQSNLDYAGWKDGVYSIEQAKKIELYSNLLKGDPDNELYQKRLFAALSDVEVNSENKIKRVSFSQEVGIEGASQVLVGEELREIPISNMVRLSNTQYAGMEGIVSGNDENVYFIQNAKDNKKYMILYDDEGVVESTFLKVGDTYLQEEEINPLDLRFKIYDASSYENRWNNPEVRYYEVDPYKGTPSLVPVDANKGWYAYVEQTIPTGGKIRAYDDSGKINSFWLGNVGKNGIMEFGIKGGDDIYQQINLGTGQTYTQFANLDDSEVRILVDKATKAIWEAERQHDSGIRSITILDRKVDVGSPALNIPGIKCTDYMSPKDCKLLFNVCDPVICPNSRCDFGGQYPVPDVIQSGIIGSIALCLPNAKEGIYVPVCLTGVKAGIDSYLSVVKSYRDCLEVNLQTGETVGICDEIHSIYMCEFFWRQSLPLAKLAIPKILGILTGENSRGGGEYYQVEAAWENARDSVSFFTQFYAANSFKAFKARSTEEVGGEVCNSFVSQVYPSSGGVLEVLTEADSPPQYTGKFDAIPFTTSTFPPVNQYKVFYHIYAGSDRGAYYKVYLRGSAGSSYFQGTDIGRLVASGYIPKGDYKSETVDFTAPEGYREMCIVVNNEEQCGFKQVSTDFAVDYVRDKYIENQATQKDIRNEAECVSGTPNLYSLLNPNLQEGVGDLIDPEIYNQGIIRVCATNNPGGDYVGEDMRWEDVGYCGDENVRCWIDKESIKDAAEFEATYNQSVEELEGNLSDFLREGAYIPKEVFPNYVESILAEENPRNRINMIDDLKDAVFFSNHKGYLGIIKGNAFGEIAKGLFNIKEGVREQEERPCDNEEIGNKILLVAESKIGEDTTREENGGEVKDNVCATFVSKVLAEAGVLQGGSFCTVEGVIYSQAINELDQLFSNRINFAEVSESEWGDNLKRGDIVIWGCRGQNWCQEGEKRFQHITIFSGYDQKGIEVIHDGGQDVNISRRVYENINSESWYISKVWRASCLPQDLEFLPPILPPGILDGDGEVVSGLEGSLELKGPILELDGVCYSFIEGEWKWTKECSIARRGYDVLGDPQAGNTEIVDVKWADTKTFKDLYGNDPNTQSKKTILLLQDKNSFIEGLNLLIQRSSDTGETLKEIFAQMNSDKIFRLKGFNDVEDVYFYYRGDKWYWSPDKLRIGSNEWILINEENVKNGEVSSDFWGTVGNFAIFNFVPEIDVTTLLLGEEDFIELFENKNFIEGASLLFTVDMNNLAEVISSLGRDVVSQKEDFDITETKTLEGAMKEIFSLGGDYSSNSINKKLVDNICENFILDEETCWDVRANDWDKKSAWNNAWNWEEDMDYVKGKLIDESLEKYNNQWIVPAILLKLDIEKRGDYFKINEFIETWKEQEILEENEYRKIRDDPSNKEIISNLIKYFQGRKVDYPSVSDDYLDMIEQRRIEGEPEISPGETGTILGIEVNEEELNAFKEFVNLNGLDLEVEFDKVVIRDGRFNKYEAESKEITDISSFSKLIYLEELVLNDNYISTLVSLRNLEDLNLLEVEGNCLGADPKELAFFSQKLNPNFFYEGNPRGDCSLYELIDYNGLQVYRGEIEAYEKFLNDNNLEFSKEKIVVTEGHIVEIDSFFMGINYVSSLNSLKNLKNLNLGLNEKISDISSLSTLTNLEELYIHSNELSDISFLKGLTNLKTLDLANNELSDISSLSTLTNLEELYLLENKISDISPLNNLNNLKVLDAHYNCISSSLQINYFKNKLGEGFDYSDQNDEGRCGETVEEVTSGSEVKQRIVGYALEEYQNWDEGELDECVSTANDYLANYWDSVPPISWECDTTAWSAAFISYVVDKTNVDFPVDSAHARYFAKLRDDPSSYDCVTNRMSNFGNIEVGDILCKCREGGCPTTYDSVGSGVTTHCDFVISQDNSNISLVGGNVDNSVSKKEYTLSEVSSNSDYFGFISCA